jgi:hypothetical protein
MANTIIQIKRSSSTGTPSGGSLSQAELAYSYQSGKLFIGSANGLDVITIGGKYFLDQSNGAYNVTNAAFDVVNAAYTMANANYVVTNTAFNTLNAAYTMANANYVVTNAAFEVLNAAYTSANANYVVTNAAYTVINAAYTSANANYVVTNAAFDLANTKFAANGGVISGSVVVTGDLTIHGNTTYVDTTTLLVKDPLIYLAANNYQSDAVDIGFVGNYVNASSANVHTGIFRSAGNKEYYLFQEYNKEPGQNYIDTSGNNFTLAVLNADVVTSNLKLNGANAYVWIKTAFDTTNAAYTMANMNFEVTNAAYTSSNANYVLTNAAFTMLNTAFATTNAAYTMANANYAVTNIAFDTVNAAYTMANMNYTTTNAAFAQANTADLHAANASYMNTGTVPEALVVGEYKNITGLGTITVGTWQGNTVNVLYGGTGATTFTTNGVLFGNGNGPLQVTGAGTEGQVLQASSSGVPLFAHLDGGGF